MRKLLESFHEYGIEVTLVNHKYITGIDEELDRYIPDELMKKNRLTDIQIVEDIIKIIK